ncbi:ribonuclease T2, partial [Suhomyces tanzawaensis NRRL Y-17324]
YTTAYYVVNEVPASQADQVHAYPVGSCDAFFKSPYDAFSCQNTTAIPDAYSCCFETSGILMQTQFWDFDQKLLAIAKSNDTALIEQAEREYTVSDPVQNSFTIHGLWNDFCNGSYPTNCNPPLEFADTENLTQIIRDEFNQPELYEYMIKYWVNNEKSNVPNGGSIALWEHEYNKHGTCMNTLLPSCFPGTYSRHENAVHYFRKVVELFKDLPTYNFLAGAGIYPTLTKQYKLTDIKDALAANHDNKLVYVGCINGTIDEIWYYHHLHGSVLTGDYRPLDSTGNDTCPEHVWYIPK